MQLILQDPGSIFTYLHSQINSEQQDAPSFHSPTVTLPFPFESLMYGIKCNPSGHYFSFFSLYALDENLYRNSGEVFAQEFERQVSHFMFHPDSKHSTGAIWDENNLVYLSINGGINTHTARHFMFGTTWIHPKYTDSEDEFCRYLYHQVGVLNLFANSCLDKFVSEYPSMRVKDEKPIYLFDEVPTSF